MTLAEAVAHVLGVDPAEVPGESELRLRQWLAQRNLGLVPVAGPAEFTWPGHFIGRPAGSEDWSVLFGVPPGVLAGSLTGADALAAAFVIAPADLARAVGLPDRATGEGVTDTPAAAAVRPAASAGLGR